MFEHRSQRSNLSFPMGLIQRDLGWIICQCECFTSEPLWTFTSVLCLGTCKHDGKIEITKLNHKLGLLKDGLGFLGSIFILKLAYPMKINSTPKQYNLLELKNVKKKSIQLAEQKKELYDHWQRNAHGEQMMRIIWIKSTESFPLSHFIQFCDISEWLCICSCS